MTAQGTLALNVTEAIKRSGASMRAIAAKGGIDNGQVNRIAKGQTADPALSAVIGLARGLDVTVGALLGEPVGQANAVRHDLIHPSPINPRRTLDKAALGELVESIAERGVVQAIMLRPHPAKPGEFELIAGERRWRACGALLKAGRIWPGAPDMPASVRDDVGDLDLLQMALAENVQRDDMHPLDEGEAFVELVKAGIGTEKIAATVGKTQRWVQKRIRLAENLAAGVKAKFRDGELSLAQCEQLAGSPEKLQAAVAKSAKLDDNAQDIAIQLRRKTYALGANIFKRAAYTGEMITDPDGKEIGFADAAQFKSLQADAVKAKMAELKAQGWKWVERFSGEYFDDYHYGESQDKTKAGVIVHVNSDNGAVEILQGLVKPEDRKAAEAAERHEERGKAAGVKAGDAVPADPWLNTHLAAARRAKTAALQRAILAAAQSGRPVEAMRLACLALLGAGDAVHIRAERHGRDDETIAPELAAVFDKYRERLGAKGAKGTPPRLAGDSYSGPGEAAQARAWGALVDLSTVNIGELFAALVAERTGTFNGFRTGPGDDAAALAIATSLGVKRAAFQPSEDFFKGYRRSRLVAAMIEAGAVTAAERGGMLAKPAGELRRGFLAYLKGGKTWNPPELEFIAGAELLAIGRGKPAKAKPAKAAKGKGKKGGRK